MNSFPLLLLGFFSLPLSASEKPPLFLQVGEQRNLSVPGLSRYSVGSDAIRARSVGQALMVKAVRPGASDLWVWNQDGSTEHRPIQIEKAGQSGQFRMKPGMEKALSRLQEVDIVYTPAGGVVLRGEVRTLAEAARVAGLRKEVSLELTYSESLLSEGQDRLESWIKTSSYVEELRIERRGNQIWVRGNLARATELPAVSRQILAAFPAAEIEIETLPDAAPTVHFRVFLLELKKNRFGALGLSWPRAVEGAFHITPAKIWDTMQLDLALQAMEGDGSARILSNPELVVRAPGEAELFAGGELPIEQRARHQSTVTWRTFGLTLKLKVTHTTGDRVRLEVFTEVSHLDPSIALDHIPGIQANRMKTQVDARYGSPLLLSGLLQQGMRTQAQGLPVLRNIPVLGALFGSEDYLNERSELVAILLPTSTPPRAPMERMRLEAEKPLARLNPIAEVPAPTEIRVRRRVPFEVRFTRKGGV